MRKIKKITALILAAMMSISVIPNQTYASSKGGVIYVYDDKNPKKRTGIEAITIDDVVYYDAEQGKGETIAKDGDQIEFYKKMLTGEAAANEKNNDYSGPSNLLGQWAEVAEKVFQDNEYYTAEINASGNFEKNFGKKWGVAGYTDISKALSSVNHSENGSHRDDYTVVSGLTYAPSLKDVRQKSAERIAEMIRNNAMEEEYSGNKNTFFEHTAGDNTMKSLNDDKKQDVLYTMVTCIDDEEFSWQYHYNTFVLAFYDFKLMPLATEGLTYITAAEGYDSAKQAAAEGVEGVSYSDFTTDVPVVNYYQNKSKVSNSIGTNFNQSQSETASTTLTSTKSYSHSTTLGYSLSLKTFVPQIAEFTDTFSSSFTIGETLSTATSDTKSVTKSTSNAISSSLTLPPQTAVAIETNSGKSDVTLDYKCPVAVTYKVAMASMGGSVYADKVWTCAFKTAGYVQKTFSTSFGTDSAIGGVTARDNLYRRTVSNINTAGFEETFGNTYGYRNRHAGDEKSINTIDWKSILGKEVVIPDDNLPVEVTYYEVDHNGKLTGRTFNEYDFSGKAGYEYPITGQSVYNYKYLDYSQKEEGEEKKVEVSLYRGPVKDENGNLLDNTFEDGNVKKITVNAKGSNSVYFYYQLPEGKNIPETGDEVDNNPMQNYNLSSRFSYNGTEPPTNQVLSQEEMNHLMAWLGTHNVMSATGGTLNYQAESISTSAGEIIPLYKLDSVLINNNLNVYNFIVNESGSNHYVKDSYDAYDLLDLTLRPGDKFLPRSLDLLGLNENKVDYYGFKGIYGQWKKVKKDDQGNWTLDSSSDHIARLLKDEITNNQYVEAGNEDGCIYIQYFIDENRYLAKNQAEYSSNETVKRPVVKINVKAAPFDGSISLNGKYVGKVNAEAEALADHLNVFIQDKDGNKVSQLYTWEVMENKGIAVDEFGKVTFSEEGNYHVRVASAGKYSNWVEISAVNEKPEIANISVTGNYQSIVNQEAEDINQSLEVVLTNESGKEVTGNYTWEAKELRGIHLTNEGMIDTTKEGTYHVRAITDFGLYSDWVEIKAVVPTLSIDKNEVTLVQGDSAKVAATVSPAKVANKTVNYTSSNPKIVTVNSLGNLKALAKGDATITATDAHGNKVTCNVKVLAPSLSIDKNEVTLVEGESTKLVAKITPDRVGNKTVTFTSSNPKVVNVNASGELKALAKGNATITVADIYGNKVACKVTVLRPTLSINKKEITLTQGDSTKLAATISPDKGVNKAVTFTSSNPKLVKVSASGAIQALGKGSAKITAADTYGNKVSCNVKVIQATSILKGSKKGQAIEIKWDSVKAADGYEIYMAPCGKNLKYAKTVRSSVSKLNVKKVFGRKLNGQCYKFVVKAYKKMDGKKVYICTTPNIHVQWNKSKKTDNARKVTVNKTSVKMGIGQTQNLKASVKLAKGKAQLNHIAKIRYISTNPTIATVSKNGVIKAVKSGKCTVYTLCVNGLAAKTKVVIP